MKTSALVSALILTFNTPCVIGQELRDPTLPPLAKIPKASSAQALVAPNELRSIRIDSHQRIAIIDGKAVKVGDRVGEGSVKAIRDYEVVIVTPSGTHTLKLYPGVQKLAHAQHLKAATDVAQSSKTTKVMTSGEKAP